MFTHKLHFEKEFEVAELKSPNGISASIAVNIGNTLTSLKYGEREMFWFPFTLEEYAANDRMAGNPFMYPFANRLSTDFIPLDHAEPPIIDKNQSFIKLDGNDYIMHGFILKSNLWKTKSIESTDEYARHIAVFEWNESLAFYHYFPFHHTIWMIHTLTDKGMGLAVEIENHTDFPIPLSYGFHPYFQINRSRAKNIFLKLPLKSEYITNEYLLADGRIKIPENFPINEAFHIEDKYFDAGYTDLIKDEKGCTNFDIDNDGLKFHLRFDEAYNTAVVYLPSDPAKHYMCIEPMILPTDGLNHALDIPLVVKGEMWRSGFGVKLV